MKGLNLKAIRIDGGTQSRVRLNPDVVAEYAQAIADGVKLPPVTVFHDGSEHWLADGFHRYHAHAKAGKASIHAEINVGTQRDAHLYAIGANKSHGLRRTNEDKRNSVQGMLDDAEWSQWTDRKIADHCGVSHTFVAAMRRPKVATLPPEHEHEVATVATRVQQNEATKVATLPPVASPILAEDDRLAESRQTIVELAEEVEDLRAKLAVEQMDASEEEKTAAAALIAELRANVKTLEAELKQMRLSRDTFQAEVRELQKQIAMNKRELQKARAAA